MKDAIVFGVKDKQLGSAIFCEIELKKGSTLSESKIREFLSDKIPSYMNPVKFIFVKSFPRTASGKIKITEVEKKYSG